MPHEVKQEGSHVSIECAQEARLERMERMISEMHAHMFVGNGQPSLMVRLDRAESVIKALVTTVGAVALAGIVALCGTAFWHLFKPSGG